VVTLYRTYNSNYDSGSQVRPYHAMGELSMTNGDVTQFTTVDGTPGSWPGFQIISDETTSLCSAGGNFIFGSHMSTPMWYNRSTRVTGCFFSSRDTWGGFKSLPWVRNEWNGPARGPVSISGVYFYYVVGSRVMRIKGS
jgi:hypothetical protein